MTVHEQPDSAHADGWAAAVAALRDDKRYDRWWTSTDAVPDVRVRHHLADYLETVGPGGYDVTSRPEGRQMPEGGPVDGRGTETSQRGVQGADGADRDDLPGCTCPNLGDAPPRGWVS